MSRQPADLYQRTIRLRPSQARFIALIQMASTANRGREMESECGTTLDTVRELTAVGDKKSCLVDSALPRCVPVPARQIVNRLKPKPEVR